MARDGTDVAIDVAAPHLAAERAAMNPRSMPGSMPTPPRGEDLPYEDGEPMETKRHRRQMNVLAESLDEAWRDRDDVYVGGNQAVYFSETQARRNDFRAPDVFVVLDTRRGVRKSWVVWEEDGRTPDVIIEITSDTTEHIDRGPKMNIYARMLHVAVYVIYDPFSERLDAFRLEPTQRRYVPIDRDEHGRIFVEPLGLWLGIVRSRIGDDDAPWLRWIDEHGRVLPYSGGEHTAEAEQRARAAEEHARAAEEHAREADERARAAEQELARLREELKRRG